jgi:formate hydrogenlyase subunit 6/NADH:ubiquinone oxidoreductase subunit I
MLNDVFVSLFKRPFTERYPYKVKPASANLRGKLLWDEEKCDGCKLCVRDCPAKAIEVEVVDRAAKKFAYHYRMDRCIYCAQCVTSCPEGALTMSSSLYHLASTDKADFTEVYSAKGTGVCREEADAEDGK